MEVNSRPRVASIPRRTLRAGLGLAALFLFVICTAPTQANAYDRWSVNRDATNCQACHGGYRTTGYISQNDGVAWNASLHDGHRDTWLSNDCDFCHGETRFPVLLNASNVGLGCAECHGRFEPNAGGNITGAGLWQHHDRQGITVCRTCHAGADPAVFRTAGESEPPPFYRIPDPLYPNKPTTPCNTNGLESTPAPPLGLDNDGDLVYDAADGDCNVTDVRETAVTPGFVLDGVLPNPVSPGARWIQVFFTLPHTGQATLELLDVQGRVVARRQIQAATTGRNTVDLEAPRGIAAGVYVLRLTHAGESLTKKVVMMR